MNSYAERAIAAFERLETENAELRETLKRRNRQLETMTDMWAARGAENARLRELVDAWMGCGTRYHTMQGACPMFDADAEDFCKAASIARELGVED